MSNTPTVNFRNPLLDELPPHGTVIVLSDGRRGWVAGNSPMKAGKLVFVQRAGSRNVSTDVWPADLRGFRKE